MDRVDYRPVTACLRPPRFVVAYQANEHWVYHVRRTLAAMVQGLRRAGGVLVSVDDGGTVPARLRPPLRLYDPELVVGHMEVVADLEVVAPERAAKVKRAVA
jgi:hypothetical protein